jgi:hypothetical protein
VRALVLSGLVGLLGCASSAAPAAAPSTEPREAANARGKSTPTDTPDPAAGADATAAGAAPAGAAGGLPTSCGDTSNGLCIPPSRFVDRLCDKPHPNTTLALFAGSTPFTRAYLRGKVDELSTDEEVLVLRQHVPQKGGIVIGSGKGTYDLLRWDGTCSMGIEAEMVTRTRPPRPRTAHVQWHRIDSKIQDALVASSDAVKRAHSKRGRECKGAMTGDVSAACERADDALVSALVEYVRSGGSLPAPDDVP